MSFSINRTVSVLRTTDTGIPLSPESEDISLTFKVSGLTISEAEAGNMAVVMVSADAGATYQFFENANIADPSVTSLEGAEKYIRTTSRYQ
ncbi:TPA: hypothetical protein ME967_004572 [Klebsiella pneumoniae]|nr:hypothetical protein [Klebsiella pneumoniae]